MTVDPGSAARPSAPRRIKQVLEAAERCFRIHGFHGTSVAEIAAAANMSVGHIYRYFASKEDIIAAIVEQDTAAAMADFDGCLEDGRPEDGRATTSGLLDYLRAIAERMSRPHASALWLEIMAEAARNPRAAQVVRSARRGLIDRLRGFLQSEACNRQSDEDALRIANLLLMMIDSIALRVICEPDHDPQREATRLTDYARQALSDLSSGTIT